MKQKEERIKEELNARLHVNRVFIFAYQNAILSDTKVIQEATKLPPRRPKKKKRREFAQRFFFALSLRLSALLHHTANCMQI